MAITLQFGHEISNLSEIVTEARKKVIFLNLFLERTSGEEIALEKLPPQAPRILI